MLGVCTPFAEGTRIVDLNAKKFRMFFLMCVELTALILPSPSFSTEFRTSRSHTEESKTAITSAHIIRMTRLADGEYFNGAPSKGRVATVSSDGRHFIIVLRKGNLQENTNEFSIYLFNTSDSVTTRQPKPVLTMSSSSNRDAIHDIKWLEDNETIAFVGEDRR